MIWGALRGSGRIWGDLGGFERILEDLGGAGMIWGGLRGSWMIWDDLGGFEMILEDLGGAQSEVPLQRGGVVGGGGGHLAHQLSSHHLSKEVGDQKGIRSCNARSLGEEDPDVAGWHDGQVLGVQRGVPEAQRRAKRKHPKQQSMLVLSQQASQGSLGEAEASFVSTGGAGASSSTHTAGVSFVSTGEVRASSLSGEGGSVALQLSVSNQSISVKKQTSSSERIAAALDTSGVQVGPWVWHKRDGVPVLHLEEPLSRSEATMRRIHAKKFKNDFNSAKQDYSLTNRATSVSPERDK